MLFKKNFKKIYKFYMCFGNKNKLDDFGYIIFQQHNVKFYYANEARNFVSKLTFGMVFQHAHNKV